MSELPSPEEFPPLLPAGRHAMSVSRLRELCVDRFPNSWSRSGIMAALESVVERLRATGVVGELWINGSFLTEKENPADVDIVFRVQGPLYDTATPAQRSALDWVAANLHDSHDCNSHVLVEWPPGHPSYWLGEYWYAYWLRQWGFSRAGVLKGIAVLQLGRGVL